MEKRLTANPGGLPSDNLDRLSLSTNLYDEYRAALAVLREYVHDHSPEGDAYFDRQLQRCYQLKSQLLAAEGSDAYEIRQ